MIVSRETVLSAQWTSRTTNKYAIRIQDEIYGYFKITGMTVE